MEEHYAGFVNILGAPNVGKSTLMNALLRQKLSIISPKAQTTRHRILGIYNEPNYQIVFSDTPGALEKNYELHASMQKALLSALSDGDIFIFLTDIYDSKNAMHFFDHPQETAMYGKIIAQLQAKEVPVIVVVNKIDLLKNADFLNTIVEFWHRILPKAEILPVSALQNLHLDFLVSKIKNCLPKHPPYFDKDSLSDRNLRFFVSEIIRENIFLRYEQELPYSCEVTIERYEKTDKRLEIDAIITVERESQKAIILGHKGENMKQLGIFSRKAIEDFLQETQIFLKFFVKVDKNWRSEPQKLRKYGYE